MRYTGCAASCWASGCSTVIVAGVSFWRSSGGEAEANDIPIVQQIRKAIYPHAGRHIGIVAGHKDNDSGAVCPDGLTEAQINQAIAERVVSRLTQQGMTVDLLGEFDRRLPRYRADAFVSIHADSCQVDLSGFKVASLEGGSQASGRLAACLWQSYEAETGLPRHPDTVTYDMSRYHAFREIAEQTPAAIIEVGFMKADRKLLTEQPDRAAQGIVDGILCFLTPQAPSQR